MAAEGGAPIAMDESLVVFCIDTSGSMCVTTEVNDFVFIIKVCCSKSCEIIPNFYYIF